MDNGDQEHLHSESHDEDKQGENWTWYVIRNLGSPIFVQQLPPSCPPLNLLLAPALLLLLGGGGGGGKHGGGGIGGAHVGHECPVLLHQDVWLSTQPTLTWDSLAYLPALFYHPHVLTLSVSWAHKRFFIRACEFPVVVKETVKYFQGTRSGSMLSFKWYNIFQSRCGWRSKKKLIAIQFFHHNLFEMKLYGIEWCTSNFYARSTYSTDLYSEWIANKDQIWKAHRAQANTLAPETTCISVDMVRVDMCISICSALHCTVQYTLPVGNYRFSCLL